MCAGRAVALHTHVYAHVRNVCTQVYASCAGACGGWVFAVLAFAPDAAVRTHP